MKKQLLIVGLLITLDQSIKLFIWHFAIGECISIIPNVLRFEPYQNTNLNWIASMANITMPVFIMFILQLFAAIGITLFYRYQRYKSVKTNLWIHLGFCMLLAGIGCSFIDVAFWGGSLDYLGLFQWFIFDMKDVFLHAGWISIAIGVISPAYKSEENERLPFKAWFHRGCKIKD